MNKVELKTETCVAILALVLGLSFASCAGSPKAAAAPVEPTAAQNQSAPTVEPVASTPEPSTTPAASDQDAQKELAQEAEQACEALKAARSQALEAGADKAFGQQFSTADALGQAVIADYGKAAGDSSTDYQGIIDRATIAKNLYEAFQNAAKAQAAWNELQQQNLTGYDTESIKAGDNAASGAFGLWTQCKGNPDAEQSLKLLNLAKGANTAYTTALANGWKSYATEQRTIAAKARQTALDNKADVFCKTDFDTSDAVFNTAETAFKKSNFAGSVPPYIKAAAQYNSLAKLAAEKAAVATATTTKAKQEPSLPAQYKVESWDKGGDCLWNIAQKSFVYGDGHMWRVLYNANKATLLHPDNPNWIEPGEVLVIPSIKGEKRSGMYQEPRQAKK
jgi:nucleoid-associated protein YgaU